MKNKTPWSWIPTLYFAEGIPYVMVMTVSVIMYKRMNISNTDIALYTSWLYLPWVIKPFWSPFVDMFRTKRTWILTTQLLIGAGLGSVALLLPLPFYFQASLAVLWLMAFSSATHDIAADGFYLLALDDSRQSFFVGIRSVSYRLAMIFGQGILVVLAGILETKTGNVKLAWSITFLISAGIFLLFFIYHRWVLPKPLVDGPIVNRNDLLHSFGETFRRFFEKKHILVAIAFLLLYRLGEAMLVKMTSPFLLDPREAGGLGLDTITVGKTYGTIGVIALTLGGILGGWAVSWKGLKFWMLPMTLSVALPNLVYVYLAYSQTESIGMINLAVAVEQFGYGFGFAAYLMFMMLIAQGEHKTAHYAFTTGFMALGMMLPGMAAGFLQESLGYLNFFLLVVFCAVPVLLILPFLKIDGQFGKKI